MHLRQIAMNATKLRNWTPSVVALLMVMLFAPGDTAYAVDAKGEMDLTVLDAETKKPIAVRLRMTGASGRAPRIKNVPRQGNDYTFGDMLTFKMKIGNYRFTIDRGPHYKQRSGTLEVNRDGFDQKTLELPRFVDMHKEGWYGGDLLVQRKWDQLSILMDAEELDIAVSPTWVPARKLRRLPTEQTRTSQVLAHGIAEFSAGLAETKSGDVIAIGMDPEQVDPLTIPTDALGFATKTKEAGGHVALLDPFAWDLPLLVANDAIDSLVVLPASLRLYGDAKKAAGRTVDDDRFRGQHGVGRYAQEIYFHLLNCGLRVAPAAASDSGKCDNPPGYNRVYVACGQDFSSETWWRNLAAGRSIVSNGPVLRVRANDQLPGHVFESDGARTLRIDISCSLATRQKIEYLEIIKDGRVVDSTRLDKWAKAGGRLPPLEFDRSGWFAVRAYAPNEPNYRVALTAPFFVELGDKQVSKRSAQFFIDWVFERARQVRKLKLPKDEMTERISELKEARDYWLNLKDTANAP